MSVIRPPEFEPGILYHINVVISNQNASAQNITALIKMAAGGEWKLTNVTLGKDDYAGALTVKCTINDQNGAVLHNVLASSVDNALQIGPSIMTLNDDTGNSPDTLGLPLGADSIFTSPDHIRILGLQLLEDETVTFALRIRWISEGAPVPTLTVSGTGATIDSQEIEPAPYK